MKIALVTSGQPSLNPRIVKEADALTVAGYEVIVIYAYWNDWGTTMDKELLPGKKWKALRAGGHPHEQPVTYFFSRLILRLSSMAVKKFKLMWFAGLALSRAGYFLTKAAKKIQADLYIGHNLGALPAVAKAACKFKKPYGFDAEDMHRFEVTDNEEDTAYQLPAFIENKYLPGAAYLSVSSDEIGDAYKKIFPLLSPVTLLNVFPDAGIKETAHKDQQDPLKLFWFSQTIGSGRGLEAVIEALLILKDYNFELHLLGNLSAGAFKDFLDKQLLNGLKVIIYSPLAPDTIPAFASNFDVGLATEMSVPLNRDICLTNKIFTYLQAGLAILASDTLAQKGFLADYPGIGMVYDKHNKESLTEKLVSFYNDRQKLTNAKKAALNLAHTTMNWEKESVKFLNLVENTLKAAG